MPTKFSQFNFGNAIVAGDIIVGLRNGQNTQFTAAIPNLPFGIINAPQAFLANNGYVIQTAAPGNYPLPIVAPLFSIVHIIVNTASVVTITQAAGQQIIIGNDFTTIGIAGSASSVINVVGNTLRLLCIAANTTFIAMDPPQGIWNLV